MPKAKTVTTELLPPEGKQISNVGNLSLSLGRLSSEAAFAEAIKRDIEAHDRYARGAAFIAIRIGLCLQWVKDNAGHGALGPFIERHFAAKARSSLANYMRVAHAFLEQCGYLDRSKGKLTNGAAIASIVEAQLDLFLSPSQQTLSKALKKAVQWVNARGLTQIYKDLAYEEAGSAPPSGGKPGKKKSSRDQRTEDARAAWNSLHVAWDAGDWRLLEDEELAAMEDLFTKGAREITALLKKRK